jgi:hypothetical protein
MAPSIHRERGGGEDVGGRAPLRDWGWGRGGARGAKGEGGAVVDALDINIYSSRDVFKIII